MRLVFMGSPEFSVPSLERLVRSQHHLVAAYTQPDKPAGRGQVLVPPPVKKVALEQGIEVRQPKNFKEPGALESLAQLHPDVIVVVAYGKILPEEVLAIPPFSCVNLHPSLLPRHRGPVPIQGAILAGDEYTGVSIMLMDKGVDSGPILAQERVAIEPQDTAESLTGKLALVGAQLLEETLPLWLSGSISPRPQQGEATYTKLISKEQGEIDWHLPTVEIWRRVRAFHPWPGAYTRWQGKVLKVVEVFPLPGERGQMGQVIPLGGGQVGIATGDGILRLGRVQLEGRKAMSAEEFVRGQRGFIGALLPS